jgi:predicted nucleic acid-binding Zn ribbon protein
MTTVAQSTYNDLRCTSYSKSRARYCLAYGRYECKNPQCAQRACGLHVVRNDQGIYCPRCSGPVRASKH